MTLKITADKNVILKDRKIHTRGTHNVLCITCGGCICIMMITLWLAIDSATLAANYNRTSDIFTK